MSNLIVSQINGGPTGVINAIINGNFAVNQRAVSGTVTLAAGAYGHDRWKAGASGCTYTFATVNNVTTLTISAGSLIQVIEGLNLGSGTYTLSWTGTAQGKIGAGSYAGSGVTGAAVGGTDLNIEFNTGTVSLVQFEQGSVATPFERRPYGTELVLCQRYFINWVGNSAANGFPMVGTGIAANTSSANIFIPTPCTLRATTTVTFSGTLTLNDANANLTLTSTPVVYQPAGNGFWVAASSTSTGLTQGRAVILYVQNSSSNSLSASAEL
jgi:hypothetical protein